MKINNSIAYKQTFTRLTISKDARVIGGATLENALPSLRKEVKGLNAHIATSGIQNHVQTLIFKVSKLNEKNYYRWISIMRDKNNIFETSGNQVVRKRFSRKIFRSTIELLKNELTNRPSKPISSAPYNMA